MAINCHDCAHNTGERCEYFDHPIGMHECPHGEKRKPRTYYEGITTMPLEQLARFMNGIHGLAWLLLSEEDWIKFLSSEIKPGP